MTGSYKSVRTVPIIDVVLEIVLSGCGCGSDGNGLDPPTAGPATH